MNTLDILLNRLLALLCVVVVCEGLKAQPVSSQDAKDLQRYGTMIDGKPASEQLLIVRDMVADARQRMQRSQPGSESILSQAGSWAKALGDMPLAKECWELMLSAPESNAGEFSALRMLGVTHNRHHQKLKAKGYFRSAIDLAEREPEFLKTYHRSLVMVVHELAPILERDGDVYEATEVREVLLQPHLEGVVAESARKWAMVSNARSLARAGFREDALRWYDRFLDDPALGDMEGGLASRMRAQMARARLVNTDQPEQLESAFQLIWQDPAYRNVPESAESGFAWAREFRKGGPEYDGLSIDIYLEIADRMKAILDLPGDHEGTRSKAERTAMENLETTLRFIIVFAENAGRYHDALLATTEYKKRFGISEEHKFIRQTADRAMEHLAK